MTFETLIKILTIENLHDNLCYLTINCDTGQHSQFLRCLVTILVRALVVKWWGCEVDGGNKVVGVARMVRVVGVVRRMNGLRNGRTKVFQEVLMA